MNVCFPMSRTIVSGVRGRCGEMLESRIGEWELEGRERVRECLILKEIGKDWQGCLMNNTNHSSCYHLKGFAVQAFYLYLILNVQMRKIK